MSELESQPTTKQPIEVGVFESYRAAEHAVAALAASGFPKEAISVICPTCSADQFPRAEKMDPQAPTHPARPRPAAWSAACSGASPPWSESP